MNNLNPYPRLLAARRVCSCFCTNNLYFLIIIFPKPIRADALPAGGWRGRPRPPPLPRQRSDCCLRAWVPKDVHTINIIRLTRDRRVKEAREDAMMRVGWKYVAAGRAGVAGGGVGLLCTRLDLQFMKIEFAIAILTNFISSSSHRAASTHNSQSTPLSRRLAAPAPLDRPSSGQLPHHVLYCSW